MKTRAAPVHRLDASGLEPGEPCALVMDALGKLGAGEQLCLTIEHEPFSLYRLLSNNAYAYCASVVHDTLCEVRIWRCGASGAMPARRA